MSKPSNLPTIERVAYEDIDDIIEAAARLKQADAQSLSLIDLRDVAAELDIAPHYVEQALTELDRRKKQQDAARRQQKKRLQLIAVAALSVLTIFAATAFLLQSSLRADLHATLGQRAQVVNVIERQQATLNQWQDAPDSPERSAEISGAQNRVSIERRRYDEAATAYNRSADGVLTSLLASLFGLPAELPLSNEIEAW